MKLSRPTPATRGFTLPEMIVSIGILGILGGVFFQVLNSGMILFAKNTAVNASHEEARQGLNRLTRDIHASISVPQLRSIDPAFHSATGNIPLDKIAVASSAPVSGVPAAAAGVSFQLVHSGPNLLWQDPPNNLAKIKDGGGVNRPQRGMLLIVPLWGVEEIITGIEGNSDQHTHVRVGVNQIMPDLPGAPTLGVEAWAVTYYTNRVAYIVKNGTYVADPKGEWILSGGVYVRYTSGTMQRYRYENGELHRYHQRYIGNAYVWEPDGVVARYISSPKPFSVPLNSSGGLNNKYVAVKLTARDPKSSNRGYLATASLLDTEIDYRSRICISQ